jgi:hypothetical protein
MKIYMVWICDWPQEMIFVTDKAPIEGVHNRRELEYKNKNQLNSPTVYFRWDKEIKEMIDYFELEPDQVKEIEL